MSKAVASLLDPITIELIFNALRSVTDETYIALMRSAFSTNIKERHDHSTAVMDSRGRLVIQADKSLPVHVASMLGLIQSLIAKYPTTEINEGDIFIANDPHVAGGTHLPDINLAMPVFVEGELLGFMCNIAHHADVGGMVPGSMAGGMSEIYQEGLRIPPVKLFRRGELQRDLLDLLLLNVRIPEERRGDYYAQIAACRLGERRLKEVAQSYSVGTLLEAFEMLITSSERRMRSAISRIPDGTYWFEDMMDDDGLGTVDIPIKVRIKVSGDRIHFDFLGTAPQVRGNLNMILNATVSSICYALKALLDPDVPNTQGVLDVCEVVAERGSILNCTFPAAVAARAHTWMRVVDVIIGALSQALPDAAIGACNGSNTTAVFSGIDPRTGAGYLYFETLGGGFGGRADRDGKDGVQGHGTNTSNLPIEAIEMEYPLRVESYGLIPDSGGAGKYRGGLGLRRIVSPVEHTCIFNGAAERFRHAPWGIFGGQPGKVGRFLHVDLGGRETPLDVKPNGVSVGPGDKITLETPGAGGYGSPADRSLTKIAKDYRTGKFSDRYMQDHYGSVPDLSTGASPPDGD